MERISNTQNIKNKRETTGEAEGPTLTGFDSETRRAAVAMLTLLVYFHTVGFEPTGGVRPSTPEAGDCMTASRSPYKTTLKNNSLGSKRNKNRRRTR